MWEEPRVQPERWWVRGTRACPSFPFTLKGGGIFSSLRWSGPRIHTLIQEEGRWIAACPFSPAFAAGSWRFGVDPLRELKFLSSVSSSVCKAQGYDLLCVLFPQKAYGRACTPWTTAEEGLAPLWAQPLVMVWFKPELCSTASPVVPSSSRSMLRGLCKDVRISQGEFGAGRPN